MKVLKYKDTIQEKIKLALGYFDAVHIGHCELIKPSDNGCKLAVFTFDDDPAKLFGRSDGVINNLEERIIKLCKLGVDYALVGHVDEELIATSADNFLSKLSDTCDIDSIVIGEDFTCGKGAEYNSVDVKKFFESRGIPVEIIPLLTVKGKKVSSSSIKNLILRGEMEEANVLLSSPYLIYSEVKGGRGVGGKIMGFPTANFAMPIGKVVPRDGVYASYVIIDGKKYKSLTNIGSHPTFDDYNTNIESFIIGFEGDLYEKKIELYILKRLRDIIKFATVQELNAQITSDLEGTLKL